MAALLLTSNLCFTEFFFTVCKIEAWAPGVSLLISQYVVSGIREAMLFADRGKVLDKLLKVITVFVVGGCFNTREWRVYLVKQTKKVVCRAQ